MDDHEFVEKIRLRVKNCRSKQAWVNFQQNEVRRLCNLAMRGASLQKVNPGFKFAGNVQCLFCLDQGMVGTIENGSYCRVKCPNCDQPDASKVTMFNDAKEDNDA